MGTARPHQRARIRRSRVMALASVLGLMVVLLAACADPIGSSSTVPTANGASNNLLAVKTAVASDTSQGAILPTYRIVAAYGIVGGVEFNGAASNLDMLAADLPQLKSWGDEFARLDPLHPVKLGIDLVVNVIQPCYAFPKWCASWADSDTMQAYIDFCKAHDLQLFFDLQLGTEPVEDAVNNYLLKYLSQYDFTHLALDTEFHFPNTPEGYAEAEGYPCCLGWMDATEINWAMDKLAEIAVENHLPRKILLVHEWNPAVLTNEDKIKLNPNVSFVLQSDGFGYVENKLGDYDVFVTHNLIQYAGYKIFLPYDGTDTHDIPLQSPEDIMNLFPQPLFISYE